MEDTFPEFKLVLIIRMMLNAGRMSGLFKDDATPTQIQSDLRLLLGETARQQPAGRPAPDEYRKPG